MRLKIDINVLNAFHTIVKSKSTYLGFIIRNEQLIIYSELNEIYYMALCPIENKDNLSLRLPVETMRCLMSSGYLDIEEATHKDGHITEKLSHYDCSGKLTCSVEIASEFSDTEELIMTFIKAVVDNNYVTVSDPEIFNKALELTKVNSKSVDIKGVEFNNGKIYTVANGFAGFRDDPYSLSLVLSNSSLKELVTFTSGASNVRIIRQGGFDVCVVGTSLLAWRRVRNGHFLDIPEIDYEFKCCLELNSIRQIIDSINTEVERFTISLKDSMIYIISQVGLYSIPISASADVNDLDLDYKLFSKLIHTNASIVELEANDYTVHLKINDAHYYMGVRQC